MNHSHNNDNKNQNSQHDSKHMWWMMAGCVLLPILLLLFSGRINTSGAGRSWPWLIFVILFIAMHVGMMFGHGRHGENKKDDERSKSDDTSPSGHMH